MSDLPRAITFRVLDAQKMDSVLIFKDLSNEHFSAIVDELRNAHGSMTKNDFKKMKKNLKKNKYLSYQHKRPVLFNAFLNKLDFYYEKVPGILRSAEIGILMFGNFDKTGKRDYIFNAYHCLKADAVLSEAWIVNPRIKFPNEFFETYLPSQNNYFKINSLYPKGNLPKIPYEEELFGRVARIDKDFYQVRQLTPDIAIQILQSRQSHIDPEFAAEHDVFYDIVEKAASKQFEVLPNNWTVV